MIKLLPVAVLIILVVTVISVRFILLTNTQTQTAATNSSGSPSDSLNSARDKLKDSLSAIGGGSPSATISTSSITDQRLSLLETEVNDLKDRVNQLENNTSSSSARSAVIFIPLGYGGSGSTLDYSTITTDQIDLDPADFPGYKYMDLELSLQEYQGNGQASARLIDDTDSQPLYDSAVSTTSQDFTWVTSSNFTLPAGRKTYKLQLKTTTGYTVSVGYARIRVVF